MGGVKRRREVGWEGGLVLFKPFQILYQNTWLKCWSPGRWSVCLLGIKYPNCTAPFWTWTFCGIVWRPVLSDHCQRQESLCGWGKLSLAGNCPRIQFSKEIWRLMPNIVLRLVSTSFQICLLADCAAPELNYHNPWCCFTAPKTPWASRRPRACLT